MQIPHRSSVLITSGNPCGQGSYHGTYSQAPLMPVSVAQRSGRTVARVAGSARALAPSLLGRGAHTPYHGRGKDETNTVRYTHKAPGVLTQLLEKWPPAPLPPEPPAGRHGCPPAGCAPPQAPIRTELHSACLRSAPSTPGPAGGQGHAEKRIPASLLLYTFEVNSTTSKVAFSNMVSRINFYCNAYVLILKMRSLPLVSQSRKSGNTLENRWTMAATRDSRTPSGQRVGCHPPASGVTHS